MGTKQVRIRNTIKNICKPRNRNVKAYDAEGIFITFELNRKQIWRYQKSERGDGYLLMHTNGLGMFVSNEIFDRDWEIVS